MKRRHLLVSACVAIFSATGSAAASAEEEAVLAQDLLNVRASKSIASAVWTHRPDSYTLQAVLALSVCWPVKTSVPTPATTSPQETADGNRSASFIGNTIKHLRDLDPTFDGRTITLVDGRRVVPGGGASVSTRPSEPAAASKLAAAPCSIPPRIQVWLLRADGRQITPSGVSTDLMGCGTLCLTNEVLYRFPLVESATAAAIAISVDDQYYIEKLRPLE